MKRNWSYILSLPCRATQITLATCSREDILSRLRIAFPEAFEEGEETIIGPWSIISSTGKSYFRKTYPDSPAENIQRLVFSNWGEAIQAPFQLQFGKGYPDNPTKDGPIPTEIMKQFDQITETWKASDDWFTKPIEIKYLDREWIVSKMDTRYGDVWTIPHPDDEEEHEICMVPKESIIFDA